jgi:uroporphyrin-III C-methyltransferase/precorrin-2 dehydrogenase/sirohydrochlorin ferrochelatase
MRMMAAEPDVTGFVWLVGAGPGATDLLTLRAQRVLQEADVIIHDSLVPPEVIAMGRRDAERISVGKRKGRHEATQAEIDALLVREAQAGRRVVRLKSGDPLVFGRVGEEMAALAAANVPFEVVPGVTAAFAAAASARVPLTLRGVASSLVFASGHDLDGRTLPDWSGLALSGATVAVYMGRTVAAAVAERLAEAGLAPDTPVAAVENAARADERFLIGTLAELPALGERTDLTGPVLILIGRALAEHQARAALPLDPRGRRAVAAA